MAKYRGKAVVNGEIQFFSPSSLTLADPSQYGGCFRRWHLRYVGGHRSEEQEQHLLGQEIHKQLAHYITTGEDVLGRFARAAKQFIPARAPDLRVEHPIDDGQLTAAGVLMIGDIDLMHTRGRYINPVGELADDPPGTVEVLDWKSTSAIDRVKPADTLLTLTQMLSYGEWASRDMPTIEHVRLSHVHISTRAVEARKSTVRVPREEIATRWEQVEAVARSVKDIAKVTDSSQVDANPHACTAYKGCAYYGTEHCTLTQEQIFTSIFARVHERQNMGLLDHVTLPGNPAPATPTTDMAAALAALQAMVPPAPVVDTFTPALRYIVASGMGMPPMTGEVAVAANAAGVSATGGGRLAGLPPVSTTNEIVQLAVALGYKPEVVPTPVAPPAMGGYVAPPVLPAIVPPDAPTPTPAPTLEGHAAAAIAGFVPPATPTATVVPAPPPPAAEPVPETKGKRGRPKGSITKLPTTGNVDMDELAERVAILILRKIADAISDIQ